METERLTKTVGGVSAGGLAALATFMVVRFSKGTKQTENSAGKVSSVSINKGESNLGSEDAGANYFRIFQWNRLLETLQNVLLLLIVPSK